MASVRDMIRRLRQGERPVAVAAPRADAAPDFPEPPAPNRGPNEGHARDQWHQVHNGREYAFFHVCGHPRSGTHWLQAILNLHPKILAQGEYHFEALTRGLFQFTRFPWHLAHTDPMRSVAHRGVFRVIRDCMLSTLPVRPDATHLGDVTPREMYVILPGAPVINLVRDGRDVVVSWTFHTLREDTGQNTEEPWKTVLAEQRAAFAADPARFEKDPSLLLSNERWVRHAARIWGDWIARDNEAKREYDTAVRRGKCIRVRYEDIHADPERERAMLYEFLGLNPAEAAPLDSNPATKPGYGGQGATSFYRSGKSGDWRTYFTDDAKRWFKEEAGQSLIALGYERDGGW